MLLFSFCFFYTHKRIFLFYFIVLFASGMGCYNATTGTVTSDSPLKHAGYVWQRQWSSEVKTAVTNATPSLDCFMVLAGEIEKHQNTFQYVDVSINREALAITQKPIWLVYRSCAGFINEEGDSIFDISPHIRNGFVAAQNAGINIAGLQIDFDCPTEMLDGYALFLKQLQQQFLDIPLSITALPTWLPQQSFRNVVSGLDHFVLQVHFLDRPKDIGSPLILCDTSKIPRWLEQASQVNIPFYLAFPTYGYRVYYDSAGVFSGLGAEASPDAIIGHTSRDVYANPIAMAAIVQSLQESHPMTLLGIAWFRLPVEGDRFNWSWPILQTVMKGITLQTEAIVEIRTPRENLVEVWLANKGPYYPRNVRIPLTWEHGELQAVDTMNNFHAETFRDGNGITLIGTVPETEEPVMVSWCVIKPLDEEQPVIISTPSAEVIE